jgi:integrase/recombinase XerD
VFATLTAPSFGPVHSRRMRGKTVLPCRPRRDAKARRCPHGRDISCPTRHVEDDPRLGQPMCGDCYDYTAAVLFNAWAGDLWRRFTTYLARRLARRLGITQKRLRALVRIRYVKVAEYQARGVVHFHAVIRLDAETPVDRASDEQIVALLRACLSARDRLIVLLMARAGLRRGELCGLRRSDVHLLADSRPLGCEIARAHLHVVRRDDNPNGAWAKSRRQRAVPLDFLAVLAFDTYALERMTVCGAAGSDFVVVNLFRGRVGAPMRPKAIGDLLAAASRRAGLATAVTPHQLRHAFGSSAADAGCGIDVVADLLGHASVTSSQVYLHPDPGRLRAAVDAVPSPREQAGVTS